LGHRTKRQAKIWTPYLHPVYGKKKKQFKKHWKKQGEFLYQIGFIDNLKFMDSSLDKLAGNLKREDFKHRRQ